MNFMHVDGHAHMERAAKPQAYCRGAVCRIKEIIGVLNGGENNSKTSEQSVWLGSYFEGLLLRFGVVEGLSDNMGNSRKYSLSLDHIL